MLQNFSTWIENHPRIALVSVLLGWLAASTVLGWVGLRLYGLVVNRSSLKSWTPLGSLALVLRRSGQRAEVITRRSLSWVQHRLIQLLCVLLLPFFVYALWSSAQDSSPDPARQLALLGLILVAAAVAQFGNHLLHRLKKVGPVEFVEQRFERLIPELKHLDQSIDLDSPDRPRLSPKLLYEYEKVDRYVSYLEWTGLHSLDIVGNEKFHALLLKIGGLALIQQDWIRAADRLELLLKVSDERTRPAEVLYRCGVAYRHLARAAQGRERQDLLLQAQQYLTRATEKDLYKYKAFFNLADVQADLGLWQLARRNYLKAAEIRPDFAAAKYNLAICLLKVGRARAALRRLRSIRSGDKDVEEVVAFALRDEELKGLLDHPQYSRAARDFLGSFATP